MRDDMARKLVEASPAEVRRTFSLPPALLRRVAGEPMDRVAREVPPPIEYHDIQRGRYVHRLTIDGKRRLERWLATVQLVNQWLTDTFLSAEIVKGRMPWATAEARSVGTSEAAAAEVQSQWMQQLRGYPAWVIRRAFQEYAADGKFPPKVGDIRPRCEAIWPEAHLIDQVRSLLDLAKQREWTQ